MKKNAESRNLDQNGYRKRAACVCIKKSEPNCTLLVSSSNSKLCWVIPGGGVELDETYQDAALRELEEEAGLKGKVIKSLGVFKNDRKHRTEVFLVEVLEELDTWLESDRRLRKWMSFDEANKFLFSYKPDQCEYLKSFLYSENNSSK